VADGGGTIIAAAEVAVPRVLAYLEAYLRSRVGK
jgi:hypothetical protein